MKRREKVGKKEKKKETRFLFLFKLWSATYVFPRISGSVFSGGVKNPGTYTHTHMIDTCMYMYIHVYKSTSTKEKKLV